MDKKDAKQVSIMAGNTIEDAVYQLEEARVNGENVFINFNGHKLYSLDVTMDGAYIEILGKTKKEFDDEQKAWQERYEKKQAERAEKMEKAKTSLYARGEKLGANKEEWKECVDIRVSDLYQGADLENALAIMELLADGGSLEAAQKLFDSAGHSGASASITASIILHFGGERGKQFVALLYPESAGDNQEQGQAKKKPNSAPGQ